jgi:hypothetical protein
VCTCGAVSWASQVRCLGRSPAVVYVQSDDLSSLFPPRPPRPPPPSTDLSVYVPGCETTVLVLRSPTGGASLGNLSELVLVVDDPQPVALVTSAPLAAAPVFISTPAVRVRVSPGATVQCKYADASAAIGEGECAGAVVSIGPCPVPEPIRLSYRHTFNCVDEPPGGCSLDSVRPLMQASQPLPATNLDDPMGSML